MTKQELAKQIESLSEIIDTMSGVENLDRGKEILASLKNAYTIMITEQFTLVLKGGSK